MNRCRQLSVAVGAALALSGAMAEPLPFTQWVTMKVDQCEEVTFKAPEGNSSYVPNASFKTAVVSGSVLTSGVVPTNSDAGMQRLAERAAAGLPAPGESFEVAVVSSGYVPASCQALNGTTRKFLLQKGTCDTLPYAGACVVSKPLAFSFASA